MKKSLHGGPVLISLYKIMMKYGKEYCYPSQLRILYNLREHQGISRGIATINRWLRDLEDQGFITRQRRSRRGRHGGKEFTTTMYRITAPGLFFLNRCGLSVRAALDKVMRWKPREKKGEERPARPSLGRAREKTFAEYFKGAGPAKMPI